MTQPSQATVQRMFDYLWEIGAIQKVMEDKGVKIEAFKQNEK